MTNTIEAFGLTKTFNWTEEKIAQRALEIYPYKRGLDSINDVFYDLNYQRREGYIKALQEIESLPKINGWVARNKELNELIFVPGNEQPTRMKTYWMPCFIWFAIF